MTLKRYRHTIEEVLAAVTRAPNGCLEIDPRFRDSNGYGRVSISGKSILVHRAAWIAKHGNIPDGLLVCHECDNPPCCDPDHLFLGTHKDNNDDCIAKGRGNKLQPYIAPLVVEAGLNTPQSLNYHRRYKGRTTDEIAAHPRCKSGRMKPACRICGSVGHNRTSHDRVMSESQK